MAKRKKFGLSGLAGIFGKLTSLTENPLISTALNVLPYGGLIKTGLSIGSKVIGGLAQKKSERQEALGEAVGSEMEERAFEPNRTPQSVTPALEEMKEMEEEDAEIDAILDAELTDEEKSFLFDSEDDDEYTDTFADEEDASIGPFA